MRSNAWILSVLLAAVTALMIVSQTAEENKRLMKAIMDADALINRPIFISAKDLKP